MQSLEEGMTIGLESLSIEERVPMKYLSSITLSFLLACNAPVSAARTDTASSCVARNLDFGQKAAGWVHLPLSKLKRDTVYSVVQEQGRAVLRGVADRSASLYVVLFKPPTGVPASIGWRWKTDALVPDADNRDKDREDAPLRVLVGFDGDKAALPAEEQKRFRRAKTLTGRDAPYATLMYIWSDHVPLETVIPSAHTHQVKMLVVASGSEGLGRWQSVHRNLAADYKRAFGAAPGRMLGVAVMTDTDNTGAKAVGEYADIRLDCAGGK
jgi:Protein of unknown function (DUF3047)